MELHNRQRNGPGLQSSVWIRESQFNTVYANEITSDRNSSLYKGPHEDGVGLSKSTNNSVISNKISLMDTGVGFHLSCDNNSVIGNTLNRNGHGIDFTEGISDATLSTLTTSSRTQSRCTSVHRLTVGITAT